MNRRQAIFALAFLVIAAPALAQQRPSTAQETQMLQHELENRVFVMRQHVELLAVEWDARGQRIQDLENYAKACGDKAGCFVPVPVPEK